MQFILNCENGKQIDMSSDILRQMSGEITRADILTKIALHESNNKKFNHYVIILITEVTIKTAFAVSFCTAITGFVLLFVNVLNDYIL